MQNLPEGKTLMVRYNDGGSRAILDTDYQLGTPFDTKIVAANGKVDVLYNGQKKAELPLSGSGWYWKVGAYVQSNPDKGDKPDAVGEVVVYSLQVDHEGGETVAATSDKSSDNADEQTGDKAAGKSSDKVDGQADDQARDKDSEKDSDKDSEKADEKADEKTDNKADDKADQKEMSA